MADPDKKGPSESDLKRPSVEEAAPDVTASARDQFLAVLSHELRNPLAPILAAAEMLESQFELPNEMREPIAIIRRNAEYEARLIDQLLDLTRITSRRLRMRADYLDLHPIITEVVEMCLSDIHFKQITLSLHLDAQRSTVIGDQRRLRQVIWNLLNNAVKFTPAYGKITITTENREGSFKAVIEDNGVGIPPEFLPKIFLPFEQRGADVSRIFGGLGLGLSISKGLVDLHGGALKASSEGRGAGAVFSLELPEAAAGLEAAVEPSAKAANELTRNIEILLVEDQPDTTIVLSRLFKRCGYRVTAAGSIASGLEAVRLKNFDVIICDLGLPDGSGHDLMQQLPAPIPAIVLSGFAQQDDIERSKAAGFSEHLIKPVDFKTLRGAVDRLLKI